MFPHTGHVESVAWFEKTSPCKTHEEVAAMEAEEAAIRDEARAASMAARQEREALAAAEKAVEQADKIAAKEARRAAYLASVAGKSAE